MAGGPAGPGAARSTAIGAAKRRRLRLTGAGVARRRAPGHPRRPELRFDAIGVTVDRGRALLSSTTWRTRSEREVDADA